MKDISRNLKFVLLSLCCSLYFISCNKDTADIENIESVDEPQITEERQDSEFITKYFLGDEVKVRLEDDGTYSLAGSDTRLFEEQLTDSPSAFDSHPEPGDGLTGLALAGGVRKWPNNTIYYVVNGLSSGVRSELQKSIDEWSSKTNIRFKERTNEPNYVTISSSGSNSNSGSAILGMYGSRGYIRLGTRATAEVIIHEIGHTLGYIHEQNRSDRDDYVLIREENIIPSARDQFYKSSSSNLVTSTFDIKSIMMYDSYTFSRNGRPTITDLNGNPLPRQSGRLSSLDIQGTNSAYPSSDGGDDGEDDPEPEEDLCETTEEYSRNKRYYVGDYVIYRGRLYQADYTRWNFIKDCN